MANYVQWIFYGKQLVPLLPTRREEHNMNSGDCNDIHDMLRDNFEFPNQHDFMDDHSSHHFTDGLNEEAKSFYIC